MEANGFWSYARGDDKHTENLLSDLRDRVAGEISMLLGREIDMFQDIHDIRTGDDWRDVLRARLNSASFMVPILSPRYFERKWCREEVLTFLELAAQAGNKPMLFPIYFVADRKFDRREYCDVREAVSRYNYFDFRPLRFESNPTKLGKAVHEFALDVIDKLEEGPVPVTQSKSKPTPSQGETEATPPQQETGGQPAVAKEAATEVVVGPDGAFATIGQAIADVAPETVIRIRAGSYSEQLTLDKPLSLIGDGDVSVISRDANALQVGANFGLVRNISFRNVGQVRWFCVHVFNGSVQFDACRFQSDAISAVGVAGHETRPIFSQCVFEKSAQSGFFAYNYSAPRLEKCILRGNRFHGIGVEEGADPDLLDCVLNENGEMGARIGSAGRGRFDRCEFSLNGLSGVVSRDGGAPIVHNSVISRNSDFGVYVTEDSAGDFEGNILRDNGKAAWLLPEQCETRVRRVNNEG